MSGIASIVHFDGAPVEPGRIETITTALTTPTTNPGTAMNHSGSAKPDPSPDFTPAG